MFSTALPRGSLVDAVIPGAAAAEAQMGARLDLRVLARDGALIVGGVLLLALCAHITIPIGPVPITGQTFAVLLLAAALGWRRGLCTMALYIALGAAGLPVFADVSNPFTYGYLAGFVLAALVVGWLAERGWDRHLASSVVAMLLGEVAIYALGLPWLARFVGWDHVIAAGLAPFVVGDALKLALAAVLLPWAWRLAGHARRQGLPQ